MAAKLGCSFCDHPVVATPFKGRLSILEHLKQQSEYTSTQFICLSITL